LAPIFLDFFGFWHVVSERACNYILKPKDPLSSQEHIITPTPHLLFPSPFRFLLQTFAHNLRHRGLHGSPVAHAKPVQRTQQLRASRLDNLFVSLCQHVQVAVPDALPALRFRQERVLDVFQAFGGGARPDLGGDYFSRAQHEVR
jgi:hypothetical protein